eukprot:GILJ01030839.1.p1 GENE.GILJ01030839.1~~GILJ01030839.1.p1  ORF type:complete len:166 (+),score=7.02 GILJ01030839.1:1-498(+)
MPPYQKYLVMMVGTLGGIVPIPAVTSFVTMGLGAAARLNPQGIAVATAWNLILTPMQFLCMVPFAQAGKVLLTALLGMLLTFDPSDSASVGSDNWFWQQSRALKSSVDNMEPSLAAIKMQTALVKCWLLAVPCLVLPPAHGLLSLLRHSGHLSRLLSLYYQESDW